MGKLTQRTTEAAKSGFQGIKKIRGTLISLEPVPPPEGWETDKMQAEARLEDAAILEMFDGASEFDLKDNKFSCYWGSGLTEEQFDEGLDSPRYSVWVKGPVASAEKLGKIPNDFVGTVVTLEKQEVLLFPTRPQKDEDGNPIPKGPDGKYPRVDVTAECFCFVEDETVDSENVRQEARKALDGIKVVGARRVLLTSTKLKLYPELKEKLKDGTIAEYLELEIVDGKFAIPDKDDG